MTTRCKKCPTGCTADNSTRLKSRDKPNARETHQCSRVRNNSGNINIFRKKLSGKYQYWYSTHTITKMSLIPILLETLFNSLIGN